MITHNVGNLLDVQRGILVHGVNCQGIMGAGIAAAVRIKWPFVNEAYRRHCQNAFSPEVLLGKVQLVIISKDLFIANAFTQLNVGSRKAVSYDAVAECFEKLGTIASAQGLALHFPLIGAGLGGGKWPIIEHIIDESAVTPEKNLWILP